MICSAGVLAHVDGKLIFFESPTISCCSIVRLGLEGLSLFLSEQKAAFLAEVLMPCQCCHELATV